MKKDKMSRQQLESMTTADLIELADKYGIDIPDNLNRAFIIGELLEIQEEYYSAENKKTSVQIVDTDEPVPDTLPLSYNNTCIDCLLRNPAWIFAFWDIKESDLAKLSSNRNFSGIFLHVSFFEYADDEQSTDSFDIKTDLDTREQYILLPPEKKFLKIDLAASFTDRQPDLLASTRVVSLPQEREDIQNIQPGKKIEYSPLVQLSGMKHILHDHFLNHRQSFTI
ncbi:MAG: DUF4912 domain-containing protein [Treponema sp.]|nr:DUF4912 domain-containing protein [Treponema sp.]